MGKKLANEQRIHTAQTSKGYDSYLARHWNSDCHIIASTGLEILSKVERLKRAGVIILAVVLKVEDHIFAFTGQVHCFSQLLFDQAFCPACFSWRRTHDEGDKASQATSIEWYLKLKKKNNM